jgi:hypothetical protein
LIGGLWVGRPLNPSKGICYSIDRHAALGEAAWGGGAPDHDVEGEGVSELVGDHDPRCWGAPRRNKRWSAARERRQCGRQIGEAVWVRLAHRNLQRVEEGVPLAGEVVKCSQ